MERYTPGYLGKGVRKGGGGGHDGFCEFLNRTN